MSAFARGEKTGRLFSRAFDVIPKKKTIGNDAYNAASAGGVGAGDFTRGAEAGGGCPMRCAIALAELASSGSRGLAERVKRRIRKGSRHAKNVNRRRVQRRTCAVPPFFTE